MADEPVYVTRREFYTTAGMLFNLLGLVTLSLVRLTEDRLSSIGMLFAAFGAIFMGLAYAVMALLTKSKPTVPNTTTSPTPSRADEVKL